MKPENEYAIYDTRAKVYTPKFLSENAETAKRQFQIAVNGEGLMGHYPEDHTLFLVGKYDYEQGTSEDVLPHECVATGLQLVEHAPLPKLDERGVIMPQSFNDNPLKKVNNDV